MGRAIGSGPRFKGRRGCAGIWMDGWGREGMLVPLCVACALCCAPATGASKDGNEIQYDRIMAQGYVYRIRIRENRLFVSVDNGT